MNEGSLKRVGQERLIQEVTWVGWARNIQISTPRNKKDPIGNLSFLALIEVWFRAFLVGFPN